MFDPEVPQSHYRFAKVGLERSVLDWNDIRRWGDAMILECDSPLPWMIDICLAKESDVEYLLKQAPVAFRSQEAQLAPDEQVLRALMATAEFKLSAGALSAGFALCFVAELCWDHDASPDWLLSVYGTLDLQAFDYDEGKLSEADFQCAVHSTLLPFHQYRSLIPQWVFREVA